MPSPFVKRSFRALSSYHIFNRGAYKQTLFREEEDYVVFRNILRVTNRSLEHPVIIQTYALMPNHFHLRIFQHQERDISRFMKSAWTKYSLYFCKKYDHSGHLCQGPYKAALLRTKKKRYQIHHYILNNPSSAGLLDWAHVGTSP